MKYQNSFNVYAKNYQTARPNYPDNLFELYSEKYDLKPGAEILEVGSGSGIASVELAKNGYKLTCIEPGEKLVEIAKEKLKDYKNINFEIKTFEDFKTDKKYNAIMFFTAFHWVNHEDAFARMKDMLKPGGKIFIIWNTFLQPVSNLAKKINALYPEYLPEAYKTASEPELINKNCVKKLHDRIVEIVNQEDYELVAIDRMTMHVHYGADEYPKLLLTFPVISEYEEVAKEKFITAVKEEIENSPGKEIISPILVSNIVIEPTVSFEKSIL